MIKFLILFTVVPLLELWLLLEVGRVIGTLPTVFLVAATGFFGVLLMKSQGAITLRRIGNELDSGAIPADSLFDGLLILLGGAFLLTPGLVTDLLGFLFIIPFTRKVVKKIAKKVLQKMIAGGYVHIRRW